MKGTYPTLMPNEHLEWLPIAEVLPGIDLMRLRDNYTPLAVVCLVKTLDADGDVAWCIRYSNDLGGVEALGALHAAIITHSKDIELMYSNEADDE